MGKKNEIDMTTGALLPKIVKFAIPLILTGLLQVLYNVTDMMIVGRYVGPDALGAVGSTGSLINMIIGMLFGVSGGASVLVAQCKGAGDDRRLSNAVHTSIGVAVLGGALFMAIGIVFARPLLELMRTPPEIIGQSILYLRVFFIGSIANALYNFGAGILRGVGDTRRPMVILTASGLVNVALNLVLVICFGMGVSGVAVATVVSQALSAAAVVWLLVKEENPALRLSFGRMRIEKYALNKMLLIGVPAGLQGITFSLSNVLIQSSINSFGATVVAGVAAAGAVEGFVWVSMNAFTQASIPFAGQNVGAGKFDRIPVVMRRCVGAAFFIGLVAGVTLCAFGSTVLRIFAGDADVIAAGQRKMYFVIGMYCICGAMDALGGLIRGMGHSVEPMLICLAGVCGVRILWIMTVFQAFRTEQCLYASYPVSWAITGTALYVCYRRLMRRHLALMPRPGTLARSAV